MKYVLFHIKNKTNIKLDEYPMLRAKEKVPYLVGLEYEFNFNVMLI
jgi:hypothetical protein